VAYDQGGGAYAARLWWMLRWLGFESVAVLDGGYAKWSAEGPRRSARTDRADARDFDIARVTPTVNATASWRAFRGRDC
jgi:thiosulfate/3-mercaptopyruvate sulfurtransferase